MYSVHAGPSAAPALSFASIISSSRAATATDSNSEMQKVNGAGKKGKKLTRVLLSTGGGRRYWKDTLETNSLVVSIVDQSNVCIVHKLYYFCNT